MSVQQSQNLYQQTRGQIWIRCGACGDKTICWPRPGYQDLIASNNTGNKPRNIPGEDVFSSGVQGGSGGDVYSGQSNRPPPGTQQNGTGRAPPPAVGATPCLPFGKGGYDYCANPKGTQLPAGCVCEGPSIAQGGTGSRQGGTGSRQGGTGSRQGGTGSAQGGMGSAQGGMGSAQGGMGSAQGGMGSAQASPCHVRQTRGIACLQRPLPTGAVGPGDPRAAPDVGGPGIIGSFPGTKKNLEFCWGYCLSHTTKTDIPPMGFLYDNPDSLGRPLVGRTQDDLKPGDLLVFFRQTKLLDKWTVVHYAIYQGNGILFFRNGESDVYVGELPNYLNNWVGSKARVF